MEVIKHNIKADLIILSHVFEDFSELAEIGLLKRLLKNAGIIYLEVPHLLGWAKRKHNTKAAIII